MLEPRKYGGSFKNKCKRVSNTIKGTKLFCNIAIRYKFERRYFWDIYPEIIRLPVVPKNPDVRGGLQASLLHAVNEVNKIAVPLTIAIDAAQIGIAAYSDYRKGTTRNTSETVAGIIGGWIGGFAGTFAGAVVGTVVLSKTGTIIGGITGAVGGAFLGSAKATTVVSRIGDYFNYDIIVNNKCKLCGVFYKTRKYRDEKHEYCYNCFTNIRNNPLLYSNKLSNKKIF